MIRLSPRLQSATGYVRPGHLLADIGTDHAYLPIFLCASGILTPVPVPTGATVPGGATVPPTLCAVAADINQGPVDRAALHIRTEGLSDRILTVRTDGLTGLEALAPTDIIIFGMGGELIASILEAAPWTRSPGVRLILQPMTHPEKLRRFLFDNGFSIIGETLSSEEARIYQTICAEWRPDEPPDAHAARPAALLTGCLYPPAERALHAALIRHTLRVHAAARDARRGAGLDVSGEDALLDDLRAQLAAVTAEGGT